MNRSPPRPRPAPAAQASAAAGPAGAEASPEEASAVGEETRFRGSPVLGASSKAISHSGPICPLRQIRGTRAPPTPAQFAASFLMFIDVYGQTRRSARRF